MKITQVMLAKDFGGAERLFVDMCTALAGAGQQVQAICLAGSRSAGILAAQDDIEVRTLTVWGTWDPFAPASIARLLTQHGSQVVQAHLARGAFLAGKACGRLGLPLVVTSHNYIDPKYYRYVSMLLPPTRDQYRWYLERGIRAERMKIISHFSPIAPLEKTSRTDPQVLRFVSLGRLVHKKGFHVLLEAFARLQQQTDRKCELHIGGTGPEQADLLKQIRRLKLEGIVKMVGWIDDAAGFLQSGHVFVLPSLDEPFGIVLLEAMALGLPVVSTDSQGPKEILDENSAWLAAMGDAQALADALYMASSDPEQRWRKGECALQRFRTCYSREAVIPQFMGLFDSLSATGTRPSRH